jgi:phospholipase C
MNQTFLIPLHAPTRHGGAVRHALVLGAVLVLGCNNNPAKPRPTAADAQASRDACAFGPGMLARDTTGADLPTGSDIPIDHIVLIMQENRSFDHYYSVFPGVDGAPATDWNPDSKGNMVQRFHFTSPCMPGGDHGWVAEHANLDGGKLDGFVKSNGDSPVPMGYYTGDDLPYYYALAQTFAISDRHFSSVLAPTWPNRMFYFAGTSWGITSNVFPSPAPDGSEYPNIFSELDDAKVEWRVYSQDHATPLIAAIREYLDHMDWFLAQKDFAADVAAGKLAPVTVVEASDVMGVLSPDEGPPGDVDIGQDFVAGTIAAVMNSPFWKSSVIFISYDENGGMYDHVVPPKACPPDSLPPDNGGSVGFDQLGFRVPLIVVSPYAKHGYVSHAVTDSTSILRFVQARFELPSLSARDANADPTFDMFDFANPDFTVPALPTVTIDQAKLAACM